MTGALSGDNRRRDENNDAIPVLGIRHYMFERTGLRQGYTVGSQALKMKGKNLGADVARFIQRSADADYPRDIRE